MKEAAALLRGTLDLALRHLEQPLPHTTETVHEARKALKKSRAALRLLRDQLGEPAYRESNLALRDAGRCLSPLRDCEALLDSLEKLPDTGERSRIRRELRDKRTQARRELFGTPNGLARCLTLVRECRAQVEKAELDASRTSLRAALRKIYRNGRNARDAAKSTPTPQALHEWRKQVKYLFNALELLHWKPRTAKRADKLGACLGDEHDLARLSALLGRRPALVAASGRCRSKLRKRAFQLGAKLYAKNARSL